jgi:hypothetical protein
MLISRSAGCESGEAADLKTLAEDEGTSSVSEWERRVCS